MIIYANNQPSFKWNLKKAKKKIKNKYKHYSNNYKVKLY